MRIQCANCAAKYEIADTAIPPEGRDVECSACQARWFERGQRPLVVRRPPEVKPQLAQETAPSAALVQRRSVTPEISEILREEAAFEGARRAETVPANLSAMPQKKRAEASNTAPVDLIAPSAPAAPVAEEKLAAYVMPPPVLRPAVIAAAEDLLATGARAAPLRAARDEKMFLTEPTPEEVRCEESSGRFLGGMVWSFGVITLLALIYLVSPTLVQRVPSLAPVLEPYVGMIDSWRLWVQERAGALSLR